MLFQPISNLNRTLRLLLAACSVVANALAQQGACPLEINQLPESPELRGFHLGMTQDQVKARVPRIQFGRTDQFGVKKTTINPFYDSRFDQASFADVRTVSLDFLDGKLVILWIGYTNTFKWQTIDEFVDGISKSLNLPAAWSPKRDGRQLTCNGFSVFVSIIAGSPSIRISDEEAQETIATRREKAAEAAESVIIGDKRTKLYYQPGCSTLRTVDEASRVTFKDKDEAEKAGYKLVRDCP